eukprot:CAMPEP_0206146046 /NCGR_PEP_ID=MMETSP1473-20131121/29324_1 /ASSEMBLY_ACC=CAM_ASM_001109 /TAXON_ID=1461547 /ORGANISM="Stichococcus sp, Strain RCC1054" /LENGTH=278 /DNA_ID=CAMNT_0053542481 /DNA_START=220 /DNA_END=1057 /DNA_ORIENTATION=+
MAPSCIAATSGSSGANSRSNRTRHTQPAMVATAQAVEANSAGRMRRVPRMRAPAPVKHIQQPVRIADPFVKCKALVVDSSYRPIDVISWQRAIVMHLFDKADVLEYFEGIQINSAHSSHTLPAVLRVDFFMHRSWRTARLALSRRNIMLRDHFTCQYCGSHEDLTLDHVKPISRGGKLTWTNCVTACKHCNSKKGNSSLKKLGWVLRRQPKEPTAQEVAFISGLHMSTSINTVPAEWSNYLFPGQRTVPFKGPAFICANSPASMNKLDRHSKRFQAVP